MIWAIDIDALNLPVTKCWEMFQRDALGCYKTYTDPNDKLLYCSNLVGQNPIEFFTDYIIFYAKMYIMSGNKSYGKYDNQIKTYTK
jgi:hypothetical protein